MEYPTSQDADVTRPSSADFDHFRELIRPFQVSDYDDLIEERNAASKCGYVFCPQPARRDAKVSPASARIIRDVAVPGSSTKAGIRIVPTAKAQMWCSKDCARRAMYIKVQLSEVPAWERNAGGNNTIELFAENAPSSKVSGVIRSHDGETEKQKLMIELARERGEQTVQPILIPAVTQPGQGSDDQTTLTIREKPYVSRPTVPGGPQQGSYKIGGIEGYTPKAGSSLRGGKEEVDTDWDLS